MTQVKSSLLLFQFIIVTFSISPFSNVWLQHFQNLNNSFKANTVSRVLDVLLWCEKYLTLLAVFVLFAFSLIYFWDASYYNSLRWFVKLEMSNTALLCQAL